MRLSPSPGVFWFSMHNTLPTPNFYDYHGSQRLPRCSNKGREDFQSPEGVKDMLAQSDNGCRKTISYVD